jgi:hypothetical protein
MKKLVKFRLSDIGKNKPRLLLKIWNGEVRSKNIEVRIGVTIEGLEEGLEVLEKQIKKIKEKYQK